MPTGRIKYYNSEKGFGFIAQDSGEQDLFMHISSVRQSEGDIQPGQFVYYEVGQGRKGLEAKNIIVSSQKIDESQAQQILQARVQRPSRRPKGKGPSKRPQQPRQPKKGQGQAPQAQKKKKIIPDDAYMIKQAKNQTPMIFEIYDHPHLQCLVKKKYKYDIDLVVDGEVKRFFMHDIKFCYKVRDEDKVKRAISYDEEVKSQNLKAIIPRKERYQIPDDELKRAYKEEKPIMLVMRGGEVIIGTIEWFSKYAIKVNLPIGGSVLTFRHAVYKFQSL
jgi:CspA family cold shock protein